MDQITLGRCKCGKRAGLIDGQCPECYRAEPLKKVAEHLLAAFPGSVLVTFEHGSKPPTFVLDLSKAKW